MLTAFVSALIGGAVALLLFGNLSSLSNLWMLGEVRRQKLTDQDAENLKRIATGLEQFAVDHAGNYPARLDQLGSPYLPAKIFIAGSDPAQLYTYHYPAADPRWGSYDIVDDGSFDPSLLKLSNGIGGRLCSQMTCKYIIYTAGAGLIGSPTAPSPRSTDQSSVVPTPTAKPIPTYTSQQQAHAVTSPSHQPWSPADAHHSKYVNKSYGIYVRFPKEYDLTEGELNRETDTGLGYLGPIPTAFSQPGRVRVVTVEAPTGSYPETDFVNAFFSISVNRHLTRDDCEHTRKDFLFQDITRRVEKRISGVDFHGLEGSAAASGHQFEGTYYHGFSGGTCYELGYGIATAGYGNVQGLKRVNHQEVTSTLEQILQSVVVQPPKSW